MKDILSYSRAVLEVTPRRWLSLVENLPGELLRRQPANNEWSALECLSHLLDTEVIFAARMNYLLEEQDFPAFDPDSEGSRVSPDVKPSELAESFAQLREASLVLFEKLSADDMARQARHAELGFVSLGQMLHEWAAHDLMHTVQAERALMQPFIAGSGPWKKYFLDHWAGDDGR